MSIQRLPQQEKGKPTPSKSIRRRSRMSAASPRGLPATAKEPTARKVYAQLCSPDGSQDMETGGSHSSDEECSEVISCGQPSSQLQAACSDSGIQLGPLQ